MGVLNEFDAPNATAKMNGRASTPSSSAVAIAMGRSSAAAPLFDTNSVVSAVMR